MKFKSINLQDILVQDIPKEPCFHNGNRKEYKILAHYENELVSHITIAIFSLEEKEKDDFWFERKSGTWIPRAVVFFQGTEQDYRGQGINGELLKRVNEMTKIRFKQPLASSTSFMTNSHPNWYARCLEEKPGMRVWEKLEERGLSYSKPYKNKPRWVMY